MNANDADDPSVLAGEYVLGVLNDDERRELEARASTDRALAAEIAAWQDRLLALNAQTSPVEPGAAAWARIAERLTDERDMQAPRGVGDARPVAASTTGRPAANDSFWSRLGVWRAVTGLAVAASVAMAAVLFGSPGPASDRYVAVLTNTAQAPAWLVEVAPGQPLKLTPLAGADAALPEGRAMQFWTKIDGAPAPTSLGLVQSRRALQVGADRLPGVAQNQLFEITLEPAQGSPTGRPTGPILFIGRSVRTPTTS